MAIKSLQGLSTYSTPLDGINLNPLGNIGSVDASSSWIRHPYWLSLGTIPAEGLNILFAVAPTGSDIGFTISGNYSVDWGDGTAVTSYSAATTCNKAYDYSTITDNRPSVSFTAGSSSVALTGNLLPVDFPVQFHNVTSSSVQEGSTYYVVSSSTNSFTVSTTKGGTPIVFAVGGTATLLKYKQVVIKIRPYLTAQLTSLNFNVLPSNKAGFTGSNYCVNMLDLDAQLPNATGFSLAFTASPSVNFSKLERANIVGTTQIVNYNYCFANCRRLASVPSLAIKSTGAIQFGNAFQDCHALEVAPNIDMSRCTSTTSMFQNCYSLKFVPDYNMAANTSTASMFSGCYSLVRAPFLKNTGLVTGAGSMFSNCYALKYVPYYDLSSCNTFTSMYSNCSSLVYTPPVKISSSTSIVMSSMFQGCTSLKYVHPSFEFWKASSVQGMFFGCSSLRNLPRSSYVFPNATAASTMFQSCSSLTVAPDLEFQKTNLNSIASIFASCSALRGSSYIKLAVTSTLDMSSAYSNCYGLSSVIIDSVGHIFTIASAFNGCTSLRSVNTSGTGKFMLTASAAVGFSGCNMLDYVSPINVSGATAGIQCPIGNVGGLSSPVLVTGCKYGVVMYVTPLSVADFNTSFLEGLGVCASPGVFAVTLGSIPQNVLQQPSVTIASTGNTATVASTSALSAGNVIGTVYTGSGAGVLYANAAVNTSTSTVSLNAHNFTTGDRVSFSSVSTVTGIAAFTPYYVVNATSDSFQLSLTSGGSPIILGGTSATLLIIYVRKITAITSSTTFTFSGPAIGTTTATTWSIRRCDVTVPILRGFVITA